MTVGLAPKYDPSRRCRPVEGWPEIDQLAWVAALAAGDPLESPGPASGWARLTQRGAIKAYGRWLTWLDSTGELVPTSMPAGQVTPKRVRAFAVALGQINAPMTVLHRIEALARIAGALAPDRDWKWLWHVREQLGSRAVPARDKQSRLVGSEELLALGLRLVAEADSDTLDGGAATLRSRAVRFRDGLMVAFLALRPLRLHNLAAIQLGQHLVAQGEGYRMRFAASETKARRALEQPFPEALLAVLERYLSHHRPLLCARVGSKRAFLPTSPCHALWVGIGGVGLSTTNIHARVVDLTRKAFGRSISPHLFRDCAATSIATEMPARVHVVMSVLGHSSLITSERHYNHAKSVQAAQLHQAHIQMLRSKAGG